MEQIELVEADERIAILCFNYLFGKLDLSGELELFAWRQSCPEKEEIFRLFIDLKRWNGVFLAMLDNERDKLMNLMSPFHDHPKTN